MVLHTTLLNTDFKFRFNETHIYCRCNHFFESHT